MIHHRSHKLYFVLFVLFLLSFTMLSGQFSLPVLAEVVAVETPIPTQPKPTDTPTPTPTATATKPPTPITPPPPITPTPPGEIPEPITIILFGTGLAALSAAAARRKKTE